MYQSIRNYQLSEFEELILSLNSYSPVKKGSSKEIYFVSNLKNLNKIPKGASFAVPCRTHYELNIEDVKFDANGVVKLIELGSFVLHDVSISCRVKPSSFWRDYVDLSAENMIVAATYTNSVLSLEFGFGYMGNKEEYQKLIARMSEDGFRVRHNIWFDTMFSIELERREIDEIKKIIYKYATEESFKQPLIGDLEFTLFCDASLYKKSGFDNDLTFLEDVMSCISEDYIPSTDFDELSIVYLAEAYRHTYWDISNSIINTKPLEVPLGKLSDNGSRDYYIVSKKVFPDGYKLLIEHSKFPDADLPEQFDTEDFEFIED